MNSKADARKRNPCKEEIDPLLTSMTDYLTFIAELEHKFGAATALLKYGRQFEPRKVVPAWVQRGAARQCFANATRALIYRIGTGSEEVHYAEGYAIDRIGIPLPIQHAWLVDAEGMVIDPTWTDSSDHFYFGIMFRTQFVLQMLKHANGLCGLLANPPLMRRHFGTTALLEAVIRQPTNE